MSDPTLGAAVHDRPTDRRQILALSGGGFRGLYSAIVLEALEERAGRPLREVFDLVAGTSIGGIIAAAIAVGVPAATVRRAIAANGERIFGREIRLGPWRLPASRVFRHLYAAKHASGPLRATIEGIFADPGVSLAAIETPLVITAVNANSGAPRLFRSRGLAGERACCDVPLVDALLATSAAPTYFRSHGIGGDAHVDGGLIANAPDLVAVTEAVRLLGAKLGQVRVLSVGTAGSTHQIDERRVATGVVGWLARGLVQLTLSAQEALAVAQCRVLLGEGYWRIDSEPSAGASAQLGQDRATPRAVDILEGLAAGRLAVLREREGSRLRRFLDHRALGPRDRVVPKIAMTETVET